MEKSRRGELRTIWDGVHWAKEQHGIEYTYDGMRWVFHRLGLRKKVPRPRSPRASAEEQQKATGLAAQLAAHGIQESGQVGFADEMRVGLIGQVRKRWVPRKYKLEQPMEYQREWTYLNLLVNGVAGILLWEWTEDMKSASIAPVVASWSEAGIRAVVWDRASGHRGEAYQDVPVARIEQPAYSPELNPAERVFQHLRDRVEGQVYETLETKKRAIEAELRSLAQNPEALKSLTGWGWIQHAIPSSSTQCVALG